jgi:hypothetical protein
MYAQTPERERELLKMAWVCAGFCLACLAAVIVLLAN